MNNKDKEDIRLKELEEVEKIPRKNLNTESR
jgi:hypothetical protein